MPKLEPPEPSFTRVRTGPSLRNSNIRSFNVDSDNLSVGSYSFDTHGSA